MVNKEGYIIFGVPNPEGILSVNGKGCLNLPPHHQYGFSKKSFDYIADKYNLEITHYIETELTYRNYLKYVKNITGYELNSADISGYLATKKEYKDHSHLIVFKKL